MRLPDVSRHQNDTDPKPLSMATFCITTELCRTVAGLVLSAPELHDEHVKCLMVRLNDAAATFAGFVVHLRGA